MAGKASVRASSMMDPQDCEKHGKDGVFEMARIITRLASFRSSE